MTTDGPRRVLTQFDAVAIIVGIVIGAGIFRLPSLVAAELDAPWLILVVWFLGGVASLIGALCFAELVSAYPDPGGEYHILTRAYGPNCGFMFAWARMTVIQTGSIALLAYIFGDYAVQILPAGAYGASLYAALAVVLLTALNILGLRETKGMQNILFAATLAGLICLILAGLLTPAESPAVAGGESRGAGSFGMAMIFVLLTYGGWNESAYISAEVRDARSMVRALLMSIGIITALYILVNAAYLAVLGGGVAVSDAVASDLMRAILGDAGAVAIAVLVLIVVAASLNVTIFTGARTNFALGRDFRLFGFLDHWSGRGGAPTRALLLQGGIALALVLLGAFDRRGIETAVEYLAPVFWLFFLLMGIALFVLRRRDPDAARPFRVPFYPVIPALFCLISAYLLYASLSYTGVGALVGVAVLVLGLPVLAWARRRQRLAV